MPLGEELAIKRLAGQVTFPPLPRWACCCSKGSMLKSHLDLDCLIFHGGHTWPLIPLRHLTGQIADLLRKAGASDWAWEPRSSAQGGVWMTCS